jgi:hypothetical protein
MEFKSGHQNGVVDTLSQHNEEEVVVHALSLQQFDLIEQFC